MKNDIIIASAVVCSGEAADSYEYYFIALEVYGNEWF